MIHNSLSCIIYEPYVVTSATTLLVDNSLFIGFHTYGNEAHGSCINFDNEESVLQVTYSEFLGNTAGNEGGAICVNGCLNSTIKRSCFCRNHAKHSPDLYLHNLYRKINTYIISQISSFGSSADVHGIALGSMKEASCRFINQSHLKAQTAKWAAWCLIYNIVSLDMKYLCSIKNCHEFLFSNGGFEGGTIKIQNFLSICDNFQQLVYTNTGKIVMTDSSFILNNAIELGNLEQFTFGSGCTSNIFFHSSVSLNSNITYFNYIFNDCFQEIKGTLKSSSSLSKMLVIILVNFT